MVKAKWLVAALFLILPFASFVKLSAFSGGAEGYTGDPATGGLTCNECHEGGVPPTTTLGGPTVVQPGATHTYTLTIAGGQERAGGLGVSVSDGALSVVDPLTHLLKGEITHTQPKPVNPGTFDATWSFNWTAPLTPGVVMLYGAGNSVNLQAGPGGDRATLIVEAITVEGVATPGEASGPNLTPLRVTGFDTVSGDMSLAYDVACETTNNNIYYGPLDQVDISGWNGEVCGIGVSGSHTGFNPGSGSYFFVVVGNQNADEGSYGRIRQTDGSEPQRPPHGGNTCGQTQNLTSSCD